MHHTCPCVLLKPSGSDVEDAGDAANPEERESKTLTLMNTKTLFG